MFLIFVGFCCLLGNVFSYHFVSHGWPLVLIYLGVMRIVQIRQRTRLPLHALPVCQPHRPGCVDHARTCFVRCWNGFFGHRLQQDLGPALLMP